MCIRDSNLYACTTSAKDVSFNAIKVYPNPASEYFQVSDVYKRQDKDDH